MDNPRPSPSVPSTPPTNQPPKPARQLGWIAWLILAIFLIALAAAGWLYLGRPDLFSRWFKLNEPPNKSRLIQQLNRSLSALHSLSFRAELSGNRSDNPDSQFRLVANGSVDFTTSQPLKLGGLIIAEASDRSTDQNFNLSGELRLIDRIIYLKLNQVPNLGLAGLENLENQWLRLDAVDLTQDIQQRLNVATMATTSDKVGWQHLMTEGKIWRLGEFSGAEFLNTVDTYRYQLLIDRDQLNKLLNHVGTLELIEGEIWLGRDDGLPHQIVLRLLTNSVDQPDLQAAMTLSINLRNFNTPVEILIPAQINDLGNPLEPLLPSTATSTATTTF